MQRIVRKRSVKIDGKPCELEVGPRVPFLTEVSMRDGGKERKLVVELHGSDIRVRYSRCKNFLCVIGFDELVRLQRARTWKLSPRGVNRG